MAVLISTSSGQIGKVEPDVMRTSSNILEATNLETSSISPYEYETVTGGSTKVPTVLDVFSSENLLPGVDPNQRRVRFNLVQDATDPSAFLGQTWVVIHGWRDSPENSGMRALVEAVDNAADPNDRVLVLDWKEASNVGSELSDGNFIAATWIRPVAELAVRKLQALGIDGNAASNSLNLIGHSLGSLLSSEIAAIYLEQSGVKVKTITALDPPSVTNENLPVAVASNAVSGLLDNFRLYDLDGRADGTQEPENFRDVAESSRAFVGSRSIAGNQKLAATAHNSFQMNFGREFRFSPAQEHGWVVDTFINLISQPPEQAGILNDTFSLDFNNRIYDQFEKDAYFAYTDGLRMPVNQHEGIIEVNEPNQPILFVAKNPDPSLGEDADLVYGTTGDDTLDGFNQIIQFPIRVAFQGSELFSGAGNDQFWGDPGNDIIFGDSGNDTISGNEDNDTIYGDQDNDFIWGGKGNDLIQGGRGNDFLSGNLGDDFLSGDLGDDVLYGGEGKDTLTGGSGNNVFVFAPGDGGFLVDSPTENTLKNITDIITDFSFDQLGNSDKIGLTGGLTFDLLDFVELTSGFFDLGRSTAIKIRETGEYLALLEGISKDAINAAENFVVANPLDF